MDRCAFTVPGNPVGKGRPRITTRGGKPRSYTPAKTRSYEATVAKWAKAAMRGHPPFQGACTLSVVAYMPIATSWSAKKRAAALAGELLPTVKPDADNAIKAICDAINGIVWHDDVQVIDGRVVKLYSGNPRVEVSVVHLEAGERGVKYIAPEAA
ncbi:MAG: RusA family crossover junction endodeoxyribonuclease [Phycisphaerae bacterium]|jgi:Holliday junction resolvase RusA-like endonuclease